MVAHFLQNIQATFWPLKKSFCFGKKLLCWSLMKMKVYNGTILKPKFPDCYPSICLLWYLLAIVNFTSLESYMRQNLWHSFEEISRLDCLKGNTLSKRGPISLSGLLVSIKRRKSVNISIHLSLHADFKQNLMSNFILLLS